MAATPETVFNTMSDVFYLRPIDPPATVEAVRAMAATSGGCFDLHRVDWKYSFLAADGGRMLCWYRAPDAESARLALRQLGSDMNAVWAGSVLAEEPGSPPVVDANFAAEIELDEPLGREQLAACAAALEQQDGSLVRGFVSNRGTRLVCVFRARDAGAVRAALEGARLNAQAVWGCRALSPRQPGG